MQRKDLTGQKFGTLNPLEIVGKTKAGHMIWKCCCTCGNFKEVSRSDLMSGNTTSCGYCQRSTIPKDLVGQKFGMLTVLEKAPNIDVKTAFLCKCDCGNTKAIKTMNLRNGKARSCGCQINYNRVNHEGKRFGRLLVQRKLGRLDNLESCASYQCICDCGGLVIIRGHSLMNGSTRSCGCLQKELISKMSSAAIKEKNHNWCGGTMEDRDSRKTYEYSQWRKTVKKRDGLCQICGSNCKLEAHHLNSFLSCPEQRFDINNGICLCKFCHVLFHAEYGRGNNTKEQFEDFQRSLGLLHEEKELISSP